MRRLYKLIIVFVIILGLGIYFTLKSINKTFSSEDNTEVVTVPKLYKQTSHL